MVKSKIFLVLVAGSLISFSAQAKLYKWVDSNGETHYGETIPPEYADKSRAELDKNGHIVNSREVLTPEERRAKAEVDAKNKAAADAVRDQRLHDSSLLNTYSNVKEIELARTRSLQQVDARVQVATKQLGDAKQNVVDLQKSAEAQTKAGKPVPPSLKDEIQAAQIKADKISKDVSAINAEKSVLDARYDADKARYLELTGQ